eukprot:1197913-Rhodomonas_salina.1
MAGAGQRARAGGRGADATCRRTRHQDGLSLHLCCFLPRKRTRETRVLCLCRAVSGARGGGGEVALSGRGCAGGGAGAGGGDPTVGGAGA